MSLLMLVMLNPLTSSLLPAFILNALTEISDVSIGLLLGPDTLLIITVLPVPGTVLGVQLVLVFQLELTDPFQV